MRLRREPCKNCGKSIPGGFTICDACVSACVSPPLTSPRPPVSNRMDFPGEIQMTSEWNHLWFNQITEYVLKLEERIDRLEGKPIDDSLSENPYIARTPDE